MAKLCQGIVLDNRTGKTPLRRCNKAIATGDYCLKHSEDRTRQNLLSVCLVRGWEDILGTATPESPKGQRQEARRRLAGFLLHRPGTL